MIQALNGFRPTPGGWFPQTWAGRSLLSWLPGPGLREHTEGQGTPGAKAKVTSPKRLSPWTGPSVGPTEPRGADMQIPEEIGFL